MERNAREKWKYGTVKVEQKFSRTGNGTQIRENIHTGPRKLNKSSPVREMERNAREKMKVRGRESWTKVFPYGKWNANQDIFCDPK